MSESSLRIFRLALAICGVASIIWFFASGAYHAVRPERVHHEIAGFGALGPLVFVAAFSLLQPIGPSGHIFIAAAALAWPAPLAFVLSLAGAVGSQLTSFVFYRYVAADWARERLPERLLAYEARLATRPFRTVLAMRLLTFTWHLSSMIIGISRVRFAPMLAATILGFMPTVAFDVWFLSEALRWINT